MKSLFDMGAGVLSGLYQKSKDMSTFHLRATTNVMIVFAGLPHVFFAVYFWAIGIRVMAYVNIISSFYYLFVIVFALLPGNIRFAGAAATVEVWAYSLICVWFLGPNTEFQWYMMVALIPQYLIFDVTARLQSFFTVLLMSSMILVSAFGAYTPAVYAGIAGPELRIINVTVVAVATLLELTVSAIVTKIIKAINDSDLENYKEKAHIDPLTGLKNRRYADIYFQKLSATPNNTENICFAVLDIDDFKNINDQFGHETGDVVLGELAEVLKQSFRQNDLICRWGGEEFLIVMRECSAFSAVKIIDNIRKKIEEKTFEACGQLVRFTFSAGVSQLESCKIKETIALADVNLYKAKSMGKNKVI